MRGTIICILICLYFALSVNAQGDYTYTVLVKGNNGSGLVGVKVWLKEKNSGQKIIKYTNSQGTVIFKVPVGYWSLNLNGLPNYDEVELKGNEFGKRSISLSYDKETNDDEARIAELRPGVPLYEIIQKEVNNSIPASDSCIVVVKLRDLNNRPVRNTDVSLVGVDIGILLKGETDYTGLARFYVPKGIRYAIDVDGIKNFAFTQLLKRAGVQTITLEYEPTKITENNINDTITQILTKPFKPTSARSLAEIFVWDPNGDPYPQEPVFLTNITTNETYLAKTDDEGKAIFLLPNGFKYMLHFLYKKDVDVLNLTTTHGTHSLQYKVKYIPEPKLEHPEDFIPKPEELFLKEFENFIVKQFPDPKEKKVGLFLNWGNNKVNEKSKEAVLEIGFSTTSDPSFIKNKTEINVAFVMDISGSMAGYNRIESLKESMLKFIDKLAPNDNICIILFNEESYLISPLQPKGDGIALKLVISDIEAGGFTNIYKGMVMGYEELLKHFDKNKINKLILLTDGYGETEPSIVINKSTEYNGMGLGLSAIGVGEDYNYSLLSLLAEESNGLMCHAGLSEDIYPAFEKQLSSLIYPIGSDAKLEVYYNNKIHFDQLYGFPVKDIENNKATIEIGNLYMGMNKIALAHFILNKPDPTIEDFPVRIVLSYFDPETLKRVEIDNSVQLDWEEYTGEIKLLVDNQEKKLYAIAVMNQSIKVMAEAFAAGDIEKARNALLRAREQVKDIYPKAEDKDILELVAKMEDYAISIDNYIRNNKSLNH
ncbi:MAG: VWA domain-containing protein [Bacteroidales bacterium]